MNGGGSVFSDYLFLVFFIFSISQWELCIEIIVVFFIFIFICKQFKWCFNIFMFWKGVDLDWEKKVVECKVDSIGSGCVIFIKQGILLKWSGKFLNKEWKKKYVIFCDNGLFIYYFSLYDYMQNIYGKEIDLFWIMVKVLGKCLF